MDHVILLLGILSPWCGHLINVWALLHLCISHICPFLNISILQFHRGPALDVSLCLCFNLLFSNQVL